MAWTPYPSNFTDTPSFAVWPAVLGGGVHVWLAGTLSAAEQRLRRAVRHHGSLDPAGWGLDWGPISEGETDGRAAGAP